MTALERLSVGDLATLWAERRHAPMHIALAGSLVAPATWYDAGGRLQVDPLLARVEQRTHRAALFRRRLRWTRLGEGPPLWVDDADFDVRRHVRVTEDCRGLGFEDFLEWAAGAAMEPLDPSRPLWRLTVAPGLDDGTVGLLVTVHHVGADGLAGVTAVSSLLDLAPDGPDTTRAMEPPVSGPRPPTPAQLVVDNFHSRRRALVALLLRGRRGQPAGRPKACGRGTVRQPRPSMWTMLSQPAPRTPMTGPLSAGRHAVVLRVPLERAARAAADAGATLNDLALAALTAGLRDWLRSIGQSPDGMSMRCSVPVAAPGRGPNQGRLVIVSLPVGDPDAVARLSRITAATRLLKGTGADVAHTEITNHPLFPRWLARACVGGLSARGGHWVNCYLTNVRGPSATLWLAGARLTRAVGIAPLVAGVRLAVTVFSYAGTLEVTLLGDTALPGWAALVAGTREGLHAATLAPVPVGPP